MPARPQFTTIDDAIAEDVWSCTTNNGTPVTSRITVGRPRRWPVHGQGDWLCPISIEHYTGAVRVVSGVGPVDARGFTPRAQGSSRERMWNERQPAFGRRFQPERRARLAFNLRCTGASNRTIGRRNQ